MEIISWVNNESPQINFNQVTSKEVEVALSRYILDSISKNIYIAEFSFTHYYYDRQEHKILLKYDSSKPLSDYFEQLNFEKIMNFYYEKEYTRRRNGADEFRKTKGLYPNQAPTYIYANTYNIEPNLPFQLTEHKNILLPDINSKDYKEAIKDPENAIMKNIKEFFNNIHTKYDYNPAHIYKKNYGHSIKHPANTYLKFSINNAFNYQFNTGLAKSEYVLTNKIYNEPIKNVLLCLKIVFDKLIKYPLRYILLSELSREYENLMYTTIDIKYLSSIQIVITDPTNTEIESTGQAVLYLKS